jgi:hypothetical protein
LKISAVPNHNSDSKAKYNFLEKLVEIKIQKKKSKAKEIVGQI